MAVSLPGLRSRPRIWAALPGAALRLERRKGPIERGRNRAIAPAFGELARIFQTAVPGYLKAGRGTNRSPSGNNSVVDRFPTRQVDRESGSDGLARSGTML